MKKNIHQPALVFPSIVCKGQLITFNSPKIMGVLNLTPDSFYDGGRYKQPVQVLQKAAEMITQGATFIDLGAYSSRPGAYEVSLDTEAKRLFGVLELLLKEFPELLISVDTFRSEIAKTAIEMGAAMVNDISAGNLDPLMVPTVGKLKVPYVMMHMRGTPSQMQSHTHYNYLLEEILFYFSQKLAHARAHGITDLVIDPGYGFAKTTTQNFELLRESHFFNTFGVPVLSGISRKSMIYKTLATTPENALNGTTALHMQALLNGTHMLRVHDVGPAAETIKLYEALSKA